MDMVTSIAAASMDRSSARALTDINVALLGKTLDIAEVQGQALQKMMETAAPKQLLDVYA